MLTTTIAATTDTPPGLWPGSAIEVGTPSGGGVWPPPPGRGLAAWTCRACHSWLDAYDTPEAAHIAMRAHQRHQCQIRADGGLVDTGPPLRYDDGRYSYRAPRHPNLALSGVDGAR